MLWLTGGLVLRSFLLVRMTVVSSNIRLHCLLQSMTVIALSFKTTDSDRPPLTLHCNDRLGSIVEGSILVDESTEDYILFTTSDGLLAKLPTAHCADHPAHAQAIHDKLLNQDDPPRVSVECWVCTLSFLFFSPWSKHSWTLCAEALFLALAETLITGQFRPLGAAL